MITIEQALALTPYAASRLGNEDLFALNMFLSMRVPDDPRDVDRRCRQERALASLVKSICNIRQAEVHGMEIGPPRGSVFRCKDPDQDPDAGLV